ncbi:hypothetical protein ENSA5_64240 [Enhygromyxa salina]|uniref:HTTM domain-containing protein n=1 Tax=Enhygromyxa salina TaxID=215803 RepID=A0A2S9XCC5_9BACT|nr:hypothetical protein [Enhygromyxa salina]PRP90509.1 hypothetical protein ENSA5_64240 [Enhygromyxa salina]
MQPPLLALADELPNYDAIALSPGVGWLLLAAVTCLAMFFIAHRDAWRKLWLRTEDPRPIAAVRIVFGFCALCNVNGLWELFEYLFMDEGLFTTDLAQHYRARSQFAGFGDGTAETEPWGFFTWGAFVEWLKGSNYSPLLFNSSPTFFWTYLVFFEIAMVMFIVGFQTKWIKWVAWFLYMGIILRNTLFWEATENVYRVFFFYLLMSRCGEGWSVDNWLRCRRLRKQGRLSTPGGPGGGAGAIVETEAEPEAQTKTKTKKFLEPIYRAIPAWPRVFVILNVAVIYCATGTLKNGPVWNRGDAFYYAFNLDHFYRLPPQQLSSYFGTTLFRLNTWVVHWWEALFPLLVFGLILRWHRREKIPRLDGWRLWTARIGLGGFVAWFYGIILYSYPVHYRAPAQGVRLFGKVYLGDEAIPVIQTIVGVAVPILAALVVFGYRKLRDRQDIPRADRGALPWLDLDWVCRWLFGRRVWLMLGMIFHGHLILTMNVGWFSPGLLALYPAFLNGDELALLSTKTGQFLNKKLKLPMPAHVRAGEPVPSADPTLRPELLPDGPKRRWAGYRDGYQQPWAVLFTGLGLALIGVIRRFQTDEDMWVRLAKLTKNAAKFDLPPGLTDQATLIQANWFVLMIAVMALIVITRRVRGLDFNPWFSPVILLTAWLGSVLAEREFLGMIWVVLAVGVLSFGACRVKAEAPKPTPTRDPETGRPTRPWAYGPVGRTLVTLVSVYHISAVASTQFPDKDSWSTFHSDVDNTFKHWLRNTQTTQGWGMFAPNPPRSNVFLRVTVTNTEGEIYDLNTDVYACFMPDASEATCDAVYPIPWISYTRQRKINRRIAGSEGGHGSWYQKWHARWVCRQWELEHGELPRRVELYKVTYPIPSPKEVFLNPYDAKAQYNAKGSHKKVHTTECKGAVSGQLSNEMRRRHGLPEIDEDKIRTWNKQRCRKWEEKLIEEARERGEEVDVLDPRFDVCPAVPKEVRKAKFARGDDELMLDED